MANTPIHDAIDDTEANAIRNFVEWLSENGFTVCRMEPGKWDNTGYLPAGFYPIYKNAAQWIIESNGYDYKEWLAEKDAVLNEFLSSVG